MRGSGLASPTSCEKMIVSTSCSNPYLRCSSRRAPPAELLRIAVWYAGRSHAAYAHSSMSSSPQYQSHIWEPEAVGRPRQPCVDVLDHLEHAADVETAALTVIAVTLSRRRVSLRTQPWDVDGEQLGQTALAGGRNRESALRWALHDPAPVD